MLTALLALLPKLTTDPPPASFETLLAPPPLWNHGPGTSGGGSVTVPGETLPQGTWSFELRSEWTQFEEVSVAEAEQHALEHGHFDALDRSWVNQLTLSSGLARTPRRTRTAICLKD